MTKTPKSSERWLGLFVGGRSSRMGRPKGRLRFRGRTLLEHAAQRAHEVGLRPVLVGDASPYADLLAGVPRLADDPSGVGPLGGLRALLRFVKEHGQAQVIVLACDMPHVRASTLERLRDAPAAMVVSPRRGTRYEPLLARYSIEVLSSIDAQLARGEHALQPLLRLHAEPFVVADDELHDWDEANDIRDE